MLYFANPCGDAVMAAMVDGELGLIDTPRQRMTSQTNEAHAAGVPWCADNGAFSDRFDETEWWAFLERRAEHAASCVFAVAPDVVADHAATLERSLPWLPKIRSLGYRAAFVLQDGATIDTVPWDAFDVAFVGGSDEFKLGSEARELVAEAKRRGLWVHMGRVNSERRFVYARAIGCDSADGTFLKFGPTTNLPRLLTWIRTVDQLALFGGGAE